MLKFVERLFLEVATFSVILLALLIFADVIAVNFLGTYVPDMIVIVRELMVLAIILPLAAATAGRAHIAVEFVTNMLPDRIVRWFTAFGTVFAFVAIMPLLWSAYQDLDYQLSVASSFYGDLDLPQWPGRLAFVLGVFLCWIRLGTQIVQDVLAAMRGAASVSPTSSE